MVQWTPIALLYLGCLVFGFVLALLTAILGELFGHAEIGGHDADLGGDGFSVGHDISVDHEVGFGHDTDIGVGHEADIAGHMHSSAAAEASVFNMLTIMTFIASFGASGLFAVWVLRWPSVLSLAFATPMGVFFAAVQFWLYVNIFIKAQASSEATMSEILGCEAEVITAIPEEHVGEIAYVIKGTRYNAPAASADGEAISRGTKVYVVNIKANTFVVRPM